MVNGLIWWETMQFPPRFNVCFAWHAVIVLWLLCLHLSFLSQNFTLNLFPDLVETDKALSASHLSAQRPTKLPEQPLEDSFHSQGELFLCQSLQISLCTRTKLPTPLWLSLCCVDCDPLKDEMRAQITFPLTNLRSLFFDPEPRLDVKRWFSLGGSMHLAVADYKPSSKNFPID